MTGILELVLLLLLLLVWCRLGSLRFVCLWRLGWGPVLGLW